MKYKEMIDGLNNVRTQVISDYSGELYKLIYNGISKFGKVYVYPEPYHEGIRPERDKEYYGINIEEKLWIFLQPLLVNDFDIENLNPNASALCITLKQ